MPSAKMGGGTSRSSSASTPSGSASAWHVLTQRMGAALHQLFGRNQKQSPLSAQAPRPATLYERVSQARELVRALVLHPCDSPTTGTGNGVVGKSPVERIRAAADALQTLYADQPPSQHRNVSTLLRDLANEAESRFQSLQHDYHYWCTHLLEALRGKVPDDAYQAAERMGDALRRVLSEKTGDASLPPAVQAARAALRDLQQRMASATGNDGKRMAPVVFEAERILEEARAQNEGFIQARTGAIMASLGLGEPHSIVEPLRGRTERFRLSTAVLMCSLSYDTYHQPRPSDGRSFTLGGFTTTYLSAAFVRQRFAGVLIGRTDKQHAIEYPPEVSVGYDQEFSFYVRDYDHDQAVLLQRTDALETTRKSVRLRDIPDARFTPFGPTPSGQDADVLPDFRYPPPRRWSDVVRGQFDESILQTRSAVHAEAEPIEPLVHGLTLSPDDLPDAATLRQQAVDKLLPYRDTELLVYLYAADTDSLACVWRTPADAPAEQQVVFAFRGTQVTSWRSDLNDVEAFPEDHSKECGGVAGAAVHTGFAQATRSVRDAVRRMADDFVAEGVTEFWFTGHSQGGTLATLSALDIAQRLRGRARIHMYNSGTPRVGNTVFVRAFNQCVPGAWRVVNEPDIVPQVPPTIFGDYHHEGSMALIGPKGALWVEGESPGPDPLQQHEDQIEALLAVEWHTLQDIEDEQLRFYHSIYSYFLPLTKALVEE